MRDLYLAFAWVSILAAAIVGGIQLEYLDELYWFVIPGCLFSYCTLFFAWVLRTITTPRVILARP